MPVFFIVFTDLCIYLLEICALCFLFAKRCSQISLLVKLQLFEYLSFSIWNMDQFFSEHEGVMATIERNGGICVQAALSSFQFVFVLDILLPDAWSHVQQ